MSGHAAGGGQGTPGTRLAGRAVVVTGGGTGLGRAIAERFAAEGARVLVAGRRPEPLAETVTAVRRAGGTALATVADVTSPTQVAALADAATEALGGVDVLVNNAGAVVSRTPVDACAEEDWAATLDVNLSGAYRCSRALFPALAERRGCVVHIASVFAEVGMANAAAYTAAKGGLVSLTRAMAVDWAPRGVRVNAVLPAYVETDLNRAMLAELRERGAFDAVLARLPLGLLGTPDDVAHASLFLASDEARWVTGVALPVDGGMSAGRT
ncbi:glucose 1-dehydrogenase [Streptomyces sp. 3MP-14]|uniref:Glucose 1-dehydrogenase n=1 Tax=Streptomyces mimosae TaxID=2586635 RepID=A0A5N5ZSK2_9ACTN|nr:MULTISPECIES: glucose 1-dehydrogenase [Streptomyces]KAB8158819.1 glucose 1-dehydrogenase [Streptomyces mimosae]KAB8172721.1 glucose 1-dehydrogenase [Streptomyces sp. 3MP-14]